MGNDRKSERKDEGELEKEIEEAGRGPGDGR